MGAVVREPDQDISLDAVAFLSAHYHRDEEGFNAVLDAAGGCPWYLSQLVAALVGLAVAALENHPPEDVDEALAVARRYFLEGS